LRWQAKEILHRAVRDSSCADRWTAARCLAENGECDDDIVGELLHEFLSSGDVKRSQTAVMHLNQLSYQSVRICYFILENIIIIDCF